MVSLLLLECSEPRLVPVRSLRGKSTAFPNSRNWLNSLSHPNRSNHSSFSKPSGSKAALRFRNSAACSTRTPILHKYTDIAGAWQPLVDLQCQPSWLHFRAQSLITAMRLHAG